MHILLGGKDMWDLFDRTVDVTGAEWRKFKPEQLPECARGCRDEVEKYGHFIIGRNKEKWFIGIPGRFLNSERPAGGPFYLWQPVRGGEFFYRSLDDISEEMQERIFGYWICGVCPKGRRLKKC